MDAAASGTPTIQYLNIPEQPITTTTITLERRQRHCFGDSSPGDFPLAANPSIVLHVLSTRNLDPQDLARLEASVPSVSPVFFS